MNTGKLGYPRMMYAGLLAMVDNMLGPSPMHITLAVQYLNNRFTVLTMLGCHIFFIISVRTWLDFVSIHCPRGRQIIDKN